MQNNNALITGVNPVLSLKSRHDHLLGGTGAPCYGLDIRKHLDGLPDGFSDDPELCAFCEIGLADVREAALQVIDDVLDTCGPDCILSEARPVSSDWWIALSSDGRIAAHVSGRLDRLAQVHAAAGGELPVEARNELNELSLILSWCEKAIASGRAMLAAFDLKKTLDDLMQFEDPGLD